MTAGGNGNAANGKGGPATNGKAYPITIDNGSGYTWIRKSVAREWLSRHPDWQRGTGAVGPSNMRMAGDGIETAVG